MYSKMHYQLHHYLNAVLTHRSDCLLRPTFPVDVKGRSAGGEGFPTVLRSARSRGLTFYWESFPVNS